MHDLMQESYELRRALHDAVDLSHVLGAAHAKAEHEYRVALAKMIAILRDQKIPVTIINDLARGDERIARLREERDMARVLYDQNHEAINVKKLNLRIIESQIAREWGRASET